MRALNRINAEMGTGTLRYAAEGYVKRWRTRFERRSPVNTTNWRDLPVAQASSNWELAQKIVLSESKP